ncbi:MAG: TonB-dependent receptor plug domain-containing protein [Gammaproteobacteria bacterium]
MPRPSSRRSGVTPSLFAALAAAVAPLAVPTAVRASPTGMLDEVVITAQRRPEPLARVGASLSRISPGIAGVIDRTHTAEALNRVPGVLMQRGSGQESLLAIRSPVLTGAGACGAFLMLEDGFALRPVGFCNVNQLFEANTSQAAAIEVLRGPGTALHGARAVHGVINVLSPDPATMPRARFSLAESIIHQTKLLLQPALQGPTGSPRCWPHPGQHLHHRVVQPFRVKVETGEKQGADQLPVGIFHGYQGVAGD